MSRGNVNGAFIVDDSGNPVLELDLVEVEHIFSNQRYIHLRKELLSTIFWWEFSFIMLFFK